MRDGVTESIFPHLIPSKGVDFPSCEKVVKMIIKDLDKQGCTESSFLREVKVAWTGVVVQETSAQGDPQSNGASERRQRACQIDQAHNGVSFGC